MTGLAVAPGPLQAWELFGDALLVGLLLAVLLPLLGIVLVLRHQVFLGAAIAQAANFGIALAIWAGFGLGSTPGPLHGETPSLLGGLAAAMVTAVAALRALSSRGTAIEARAGLVFLLGGSGAMLLLAEAPHGLQEVQRLMLSSLLGASRGDVYVVAVALVATVLFALRHRRRLLLWAMDPVSAHAYGTPPWRYDLLVGAWLGAVVGFAIHATGLTFTFGCTVLPVLVAREVAGSLATVAWLAPTAGALLYGIGFLLADRLDVPPGQCAVVVMGLAALALRMAARLGRLPS